MLLQSTMNKPCESPSDGAQAHHEAPDQLNSSSSSSPLLMPSPVSDIPTSSCPPAPSRPTSAHNSAQIYDRKATVACRVEVRLLVRRREAGALIGKRGANIKRLRETFSKSTFNIPDTGNGPERVVCILADGLASLEAILADLAQLFLEKSCQLAKFQPARRNQDHDLIELKQLINSSHAGLLIGMGGQSIRKLRNDSKAAIKIYEMCCPNSNERVCAIKAKPPVVVSAIKMIQEIIDAAPATLKASIVHKPYDALNYDLSLIDKYGGYAPDDLGPLELMQLAGAQANLNAHTREHQFPSSSSSSPSSSFDLHHLINSNSVRQTQNKSTPPRTSHVCRQASMFLNATAASLASHQANLLPDGISALLGALDHSMLSAHLRRLPHAPLMRQLDQRGHHPVSRYHPYLPSSSSSPPPLAGYAARSKHHLQEHENLLIAQHLQMLSARQHQLLRTPAGGGPDGWSCCSHSQHHSRHHTQQQPQQQQQQQSDNPANSFCSCASTSCDTNIAQRSSKQNNWTSGGGEMHPRKFTDSGECQPPLAPLDARAKQTTQNQPPPPV